MAVLVSACIIVSYANARKLVRLSDGTLYCLYLKSPNGTWQVYVKKSTDNGSTWTDETRISTYAGMSDYNQFVASIAVDSFDHLHVVWYGMATGFTTASQLWYNKYDGSWAGPVRISTYSGMQGYGQRFPSIAVDGSDNLHVVWDGMATGFTTDNQIWYAKYTDSWSEPVRISTLAGMEDYEQLLAEIAIDSSDNLHVVWTGKADVGTSHIYYNKYDGSWADPVSISTYAGMHIRAQSNSSIAVDSNDYIHVVWNGEADGFLNAQIWYNKYDGSWAGPVRISDYASMFTREQRRPSIAVDVTNAVHVLWYGKATGYIDFQKIWRAKYVTSWGTPELLQDMESDLRDPNLRWSRYPSSNIPYAVDYVFFNINEMNMYWDKVVTTPTVTTNPATALSAIAATPNGTLDQDGGEACDVRFQYGETSDYGIDTEWQSGKESVIAFEQAITGLSPNTTYHFRAQARNSAGTVNGADRTFTTLVAAPSVTTNPATALSAIAATPNGILNQDGGEACECGFEWGLSIGYGTTTPPQSKRTGETFSHVIGGLFPNTTYHFRAFATNSVGTGHGDDRTFTTALVISRAYALAREEL